MSNEQPNRLAPKEESKLDIKALSDPQNVKELQKLFKTLKSCYGPYSSNILLENDLGGTVMATSSCVRLLNALPFDNPLVRLVTTAAIGHGNNFSDATLTMALLTLSLIKESVSLDINRHLITTVFELILEECMAHLASNSCKAKVALDFRSTTAMYKLARSVISTKPGNMLDQHEIDQIARLVLVCFISGISEKDISNLHMVSIEGHRVAKSEVHPGFLYDAPEVWNQEDKPVPCRTVQSKIRTVLLGCSMAGDTEDYIDVKFENSSRVRKEQVVIQQIRQWLDAASKLDIGIVFCQKVVHTDFKQLLKERNIVCIERLGTKGANIVQRLTGCPLLHSIHTAPKLSECGCVGSISQLVVCDKMFLHIEPVGGENEKVSTLVLCHHSEDALDELKASCEQAFSVLRSSMSEPHALQGGGCWITQLAHHIIQQAESSPSWLSAAECPPHMLAPIIHAFLRALRRLPSLLRTDREHYVDNTTHHHWMLSPAASFIELTTKCVCGAVQWNKDMELVAFEELMLSDSTFVKKAEKVKQKSTDVLKRMSMYSRNLVDDSDDEEDIVGEATVLDGYTASSHALQIGVLAANMVLSVSNVISDCN